MSKLMRKIREKAEVPGPKRLRHIDRYFEGFVLQPVLHSSTGKPRHRMIYAGIYYHFIHQKMAFQRAKLILTFFVLLYIGLYLFTSLLPSIGSSILLCYLPGLFLLFPCILLLLGLISVWRAKNQFIARYKYSTLPNLKKGVIFALLLNSLWLLLWLIWLMRIIAAKNSASLIAQAEIAWLLCQAASFAVLILLWNHLKAFRIVECSCKK